MLSVLTLVVFLVAIIVLLVLFAAIDVVFEAKGSGLSIEHSVKVHWLVFSRKVYPENGTYGSPDGNGYTEGPVNEQMKSHSEEAEKQKKNKKDKKKKKWSIYLSFSEMLQIFRQLRLPVIRLIRGLIYAIRVPAARINAVYGFGDPAYTGMVCGYTHALQGYLAPHSENMRVRMEPDFIDTRLDLDMSGTVRIRPYRFIPVIINFVLDRDVLRFSWKFLKKGLSKRSGVNF